MSKVRQCDRTECFANTSPQRYRNCCTALEEVPMFECPFFKSKGEIKDERESMRKRADEDRTYRALLENYGIRFNKRGRKSNDK